MSQEPLPEGVRQLIGRHLPSMDHVAALVALHAGALGVNEIAAETRLSPTVTATVLGDLVESRLAVVENGQFRVHRESPHASTVEQVIALYHSKPVTLVRAVYDRPAAARSFADAFRIRKGGD
jgi:hypothetical protein